MSEFVTKIGAMLDMSKIEQQLKSLENKKIKLDVELNKDAAKTFTSNLQKGLKSSKLDIPSLSQQLAGSFNISDKSIINKIKSQLNNMLSELGKTWNGKELDFSKPNGFMSGMDELADMVTKNANVVKSKMGIYDDFYNYFKNKKIYVSDALKDAMGEDSYKEILNNNIGKIVRDASKGISIDSIWGEMTSLFPEHFSADITNQVDQIVHAFDLMKRARADMQEVIPASNLNAQDFMGLNGDVYAEVISMSNQMAEKLQQNLHTATAESGNTIDLDINIDTAKIESDIRNAVQSAAGSADEPIPINLKLNDESLVTELRTAMNGISAGDEPVQVDIKVNKEDIQADLNAALTDLDLPIKFKIDADDLEADIRAAVNSITDIEIDLRVNTDTLQESVNDSANQTTQDTSVNIPQIDMGNLSEAERLLGGVNAAGRQGQSVFQSFGSSVKEAFSAFTMANMMQDAIYKVGDAAREGIATVKEFNDIKTDLAMATGENKSYVEGLMQDYTALGQTLGTLTQDVAMSASEWVRQGRSLSETQQLIKDSVIFAKNSQLNTSDASEILTATLNGYQMAAEQASHVADVINNLDLKSASSAEDIGTALSRVASMANNAGVSFERTSAMIATVKDVTQQSGEVVGNSMKSILSRINNIRAGKFVDSESGEALNDVEKVLNKIGISMRDVNGQFMDSETIIDNVAEKWTGLDKLTQKAVSTALGGTYQANAVIALLDNYDKVKELTDVAFNSDGVAQSKFENNYLTSLEAKTNALKSSMAELATTTLSDDIYAGFLDGAKAVTDFITQTDLLKASMAGLGTVGAGFAFGWIRDVIQGFSDMGKAMDIVKSGNISNDMFNGLLQATNGLSESQTRLVLSSTALSEAQRAAILMNQGMSAAEAQSAVAAMGLAGAEGTATGATISLSGAFQGLWATLAANPLILVAAGVAAAVSAVSVYNKSIEEAVSTAKNAGNAWEESNNSIQSYIDRITELRTQLESGTLTEQEAYQAKSELLSIQESLSDSYGSQVAGIDLVNGSLTEQIALLEQVSQKESERFLNENKKGINKATKEMEKDRHTYLGQFYDNGTGESEAIKQSIKNLQDKYGEDVFKLEQGMDDMELNIHFNADASTAKDALNDLMTDVTNIEKEYGKSDVLTSISDYAAQGLTDTNKVLDKYQDLYDQARLVSDTETFKAPDGKDQTAIKWLNDYTKAVDNYNKALAEGDTDKIADAATQFNAVDTAVSSLLKNSDMSAYADQFGEVKNQLNEAAIASNNFNKALSGNDMSKFGKSVSKSAEELKNLNLTDADFKYAFETDGVQEGETAINSLVKAALECGFISDTSSGQVDKLVSTLVSLGTISSGVGGEVDTVTESVSALTEQVTSANTALSGINAASALVNSQSTGKSISLEDFNSADLADYTSALEYNNGALQLNAEKVRELQQAKADEAIQANNNLKLEQQSQYMRNIAEIEQLQDKLRGLNDAKGEEANTIQSSIDALLSENDGIINQCNQLDLLSAALREATGAYQNWMEKQNGPESGDMFDDALGAMQAIDNVSDKKSEEYGRVGTNKYKAAVEFVVPESVDATDQAAVQSYLDSIANYFTYDESGNRAGLNIEEFCRKSMEQGLMTLDEASGEYQVAGQRTMEDFAEGLGLALPLVQAMFGEMEEFGGEFTWPDEAIKTFGDMGTAAGEAKASLESLPENKDMNIQIDVSDLESTEDKVSTLQNTISQMQELKGRADVDASSVENANAIIQYCLTQIQMLNTPAVMKVDTSQVDGALGEALGKLQEFQNAQNNLQMQAEIGADTSEAQSKVDGLVGELQGLSPEIMAKLNIDTTSADTISASIAALTPEVMVKAGVDSAVVDAWAAEEKQSNGKVTWTNNTGAVDAWAAQMHTSNGTVNWTNNTAAVRTSFTATGTVNWTNTTPPTGGTHGLNGTAHAAGTADTLHYPHLIGHANAKGNWGAKTDGVSLVGELGREIVVNPKTGMWHTVGDNGAEFQYIPAGSIVFNHKQTEALLERGFINSRGKAYASGTAMVKGGISVQQAQNSTVHYKPYTPKPSYTPPKTSSTDTTKDPGNNNQKTDKALDDIIKGIGNIADWIQRMKLSLENQAEKYQKKIDSASSYAAKDKYIDKKYSANQKLINMYDKAIPAYQKKADEVAKKVGLTDELKKKVQNGTIAFQDLGEDDKKRVETFKEWFDKIKECESATLDLKKAQQDLIALKYDTIIEKYDTIKSPYSTKSAVYKAKNEYRYQNGNSQAVGSEYFDNLKAMRQKQSKQNELTEKEANKLQAEINRKLKSKDDNLKDYTKSSAAYKKDMAKLNEIWEAFWNGKAAVEEFNNEIFKAKLQLKTWQTEKFERGASKQELYRQVKESMNYKGGIFEGGITEQDYKEAIKTNDRIIKAAYDERATLQKEMMTMSPTAPLYRDYAEQVAALDEKILKTTLDNGELKKSIVEMRFEPFRDAQEALEDVTDEYEVLMSMIRSDSYLNNDATWSDQGLANIKLLQEGMEAQRQIIANAKAHLNDIQKEYDNHNITPEQYEEMTKATMTQIRQASKTLYDYNQKMLDMYEQQITKENELLRTNIDKRKEALSWKEKYYDYDKNIQKQSKDINSLKSMIAALEGTTNQASRARLEKLKAELAEAEEKMADTVHDHETELKQAGYDSLEENANESLDNTLEALKKNTEFQKSVINNMLDQMTDSYDKAFAHIGGTIEDFGLKMTDLFNSLVSQMADVNKAATNDYKADSNATGGNHDPIEAGDGVGNSTADKNIADVADQNSTSNGANLTYGDNDNDFAKSVKFATPSIFIGKGKSVNVAATIQPDNAKDKRIKISVKPDAKIATASINGQKVTIKGVGQGTTKVGVETYWASCQTSYITVYVTDKAVYEAISKFEQDNGMKISAAEKAKMYADADNLISGGFVPEVAGDTVLKSVRKKYIGEWFNNLPSQKFSKDEIANVSKLAGHFMSKGKKVNRYDLFKLANLVGADMSGHTAEDYESWGSKLKDTILAKVQYYGYKTGGFVTPGRYIPLKDVDSLAKAKGEWGMVAARRGEFILNETLSKALIQDIPKATSAMTDFTQLYGGNLANAAGSLGNMINNPTAFNMNNYGPLVNIQGNVDQNVMSNLEQFKRELFDDFYKQWMYRFNHDYAIITGKKNYH